MTPAEIAELVGGIVVVLGSLAGYLKSRTASAISAQALAKVRAHEAMYHPPVTPAPSPPPPPPPPPAPAA